MSVMRSGAFVFGAVTDALRIVVGWMEAVHDSEQVESSLTSLLELVKGHRACLLRLQLDTGVQTTVARVDFGRKGNPPADADVSFSQYLLGHGLGKAQWGSVWFLSDLGRELAADRDADARLCVPDKHTREMAVVVLEPGSRSTHVLQVDFNRWLSPRESESLSMLMAVLARVWLQRRPELVAELAGSGDASERTRPAGRFALDPSNPAGLSRAEYRVCVLLGQGMCAKAIARMLMVSESTVRSHLRSIYAKTETNGQRELMYRLLGPGGPGRGNAPSPAPQLTRETLTVGQGRRCRAF